jgi:hypothetical protein
MKNEFLKLDLPYFFRKRILGNISLGPVKLEFRRKGTEGITEDIQRWADDGGQMLDLGNPIDPPDSDLARKQANEG